MKYSIQPLRRYIENRGTTDRKQEREHTLIYCLPVAGQSQSDGRRKSGLGQRRAQSARRYTSTGKGETVTLQSKANLQVGTTHHDCTSKAKSHDDPTDCCFQWELHRRDTIRLGGLGAYRRGRVRIGVVLQGRGSWQRLGKDPGR
eukprot:1402842-Rhodomonas_salina.1